MNKKFLIIGGSVAALAVVGFSMAGLLSGAPAKDEACGKHDASSGEMKCGRSTKGTTDDAHGEAGCGAAPGEATDSGSGAIRGTVVETMNASRYTYVQIDTGEKKVWAAGPVTAIKIGDVVSIGSGNPNKNFHSPTLNRTFEELYFTGAIRLSGPADHPEGAEKNALPPGHPAVGKEAGSAPVVAGPEAGPAPAGVKTVAQVLDQTADLAGHRVPVRGRVVKVVPKIMGMNWVHLRDGTGGEGGTHLTVTTKDNVTVGAIVTATGLISTDKDFGAGYHYDVIMEDAALSL